MVTWIAKIYSDASFCNSSCLLALLTACLSRQLMRVPQGLLHIVIGALAACSSTKAPC